MKKKKPDAAAAAVANNATTQMWQRDRTCNANNAHRDTTKWPETLAEFNKSNK